MILNSIPKVDITIQIKKRVNNKHCETKQNTKNLRNHQILFNGKEEKNQHHKEQNKFCIHLVGHYLNCDSIISKNDKELIEYDSQKWAPMATKYNWHLTLAEWELCSWRGGAWGSTRFGRTPSIIFGRILFEEQRKHCFMFVRMLYRISQVSMVF